MAAVQRTGYATRLLAILLLPALLTTVGTWEAWRGRNTVAEYAEAVATMPAQVARMEALARRNPQASIRFEQGGQLYGVSVALAMMRRGEAELGTDLLVARWREPAAWLAAGAGLASLLAAAVGTVLMLVAARRGRQSRAALVAAFERVRHAVPAALGCLVGGLALALLGGVAFEASGLWFLPRIDTGELKLAAVGVVLAGAVLWGAVSTLRSLRGALRLFEPRPTPLFAFPVAEGDAPGLFALLRELAGERGAAMPDVVAVGAVESFFVTSFPRDLWAASTLARGRTLHLPLPVVATLSPGELRTVLAHELAHFSGEDTAYSMRFAPVYAGLERSVAAVAAARGGFNRHGADMLLQPHLALANLVFEQFHLVVQHWSRQRELEADRAAVQSGSADALATSLLRTGLAGAALDEALARIAEHPGDAPPDLSAALVARSRAEGLGDPAAHLADRPPHPTDSHPPTLQRIEAAGVAADPGLLARAARPVDDGELAAVRALFADWDGLNRMLAEAVRTVAAERRQEYREVLAAAADAAGPEPVALHENRVGPFAGLGVVLAVCLLLAAGMAYILQVEAGPGLQSQAGWAAALAAFLALAGWTAYCIVRLAREREPFLVLDADGLRSPGWVGVVPWAAVKGITLTAGRALLMTFALEAGAPLPARTGRIRRLRRLKRQHALEFRGMSVRGMKVQDVQALLARHAQAAFARRALASEGWED